MVAPMTRRFPLAALVFVLIGATLLVGALAVQTTPATSAIVDADSGRSSSLVLNAPPPYCPHDPGDNPGQGNGNGRDRERPCGPKDGSGPDADQSAATTTIGVPSDVGLGSL